MSVGQTEFKPFFSEPENDLWTSCKTGCTIILEREVANISTQFQNALKNLNLVVVIKNSTISKNEIGNEMT